MSRAIRITDGQRELFVEVDESVRLPTSVELSAAPSLDQLPEGMRPVADVSKLERSFEEVKDLIVDCGNGLFDAIRKLPSPDRVCIEFGIKFGGEAGVPMLTKASGEANFKISLEWKGNQHDESSHQ